MQRRRSKLQKDIIHLLQNKKIRTQKEISDLLDKNPSSINRSINLLIKEGVLARSEEGYSLTSRLSDFMKTRDLFRNSSFGLERISKELSSSRIASAFDSLDLMSKTLKSYNSGIVGYVQSHQDSWHKAISNSLVLDDYFKNSRGRGFLELTKVIQQSSQKISEMMKVRFQPIMESIAKLSFSFNELMKMQLKGSETISLKLAALNSLSLNDSLRNPLESMASGLLETTKNLQVYSINRVRAAQKEFPDVGDNLFKFETASLVYKNLSLSLPYIEDMAVPEISEFEADFSIEIIKSKELKKLLIKINPELDRKREGAWECILSENQDKYSQSANSMINLLDWTLREFAPGEDVKNYFNLEKKDKITRKMKLEYILRSNQDTKLINFYIKNFLDIYEFLNNAKHSLKFDEGDVLESHFYIIEGIILFIIKSNPENN